MNNNEIYETIAESLQNDINDDKITQEFASLLNDIAYDVYVEGATPEDNVVSVLNRYIEEAAADVLNDETEEVLQESAESDSDDEYTYESVEEEASFAHVMGECVLEMTDSDSFYESVNATVDSISKAYESGEITEEEFDALSESVNAKIEEYIYEKSIKDTVNKFVERFNKGKAKEVKDAIKGSGNAKDAVKKMLASSMMATTLATSLTGAGIPKAEASKIAKDANLKYNTVAAAEISKNIDNESPSDIVVTINGKITDVSKALAEDLYNGFKNSTDPNYSATYTPASEKEKMTNPNATGKKRVTIKTNGDMPLDMMDIALKAKKAGEAKVAADKAAIAKKYEGKDTAPMSLKDFRAAAADKMKADKIAETKAKAAETKAKEDEAKAKAAAERNFEAKKKELEKQAAKILDKVEEYDKKKSNADKKSAEYAEYSSKLSKALDEFNAISDSLKEYGIKSVITSSGAKHEWRDVK